MRVGDVCLAVGNPLGIGESVTAGIISAKGRATGISDGSFQDFLQTDAPINQGNSGGALVNTRGELIGINSQILSPNGGGNIGIGFAIPSNMAKTVMSQLIGKGKVNRGMLGVTIQPVTSDLAQGLGLKEARGVAISSRHPRRSRREGRAEAGRRHPPGERQDRERSERAAQHGRGNRAGHRRDADDRAQRRRAAGPRQTRRTEHARRAQSGGGGGGSGRARRPSASESSR